MTTIATTPADLGGPFEMTTSARIATVHLECGLPLQLALLGAIETVLRDFGVDHVWIDPTTTSDMVVLAEVASS